MIKQEHMRVVKQKPIAKAIYELTLEGELVREMNEPGQFIHIRTHEGVDPLLRRPISIASIDHHLHRCTIIYRKEGKGTSLLASKHEGENVDVLGPLGNGFPIEEISKHEVALIVGGGIGVPPLFELSKQLRKKEVEVIHILGFASAEQVFYEEQFHELGDTYIATADGSYGIQGFVTDVLEQQNFSFDYLYACGPTPMLSALDNKYRNKKKGYLSLEQRMGCGIGACFACVCHIAGDETGTKYKKVCSDGPVFPLGEVIL